MKSKYKSALKIGALQSLLMALYHFFIPLQFNWQKFIGSEAPTINWSLFALNNYFSFNLLALSTMLLYHLAKKDVSQKPTISLSFLLLLFWLYSTLYQLVKPMPLPVHLSWLNFVLLGVAILNMTLFALPLVANYRSIQSTNKLN